MSLLEVRNIKRDFRLGTEVLHVLKGINLNIEKGEYVALMGPSGSGKSTLMNILGCLDTPTSGEYILNGKDVSKMSDSELADIRNKEIGFVFQTFNLMPRTTALDNVALPMVYAGVKKEKRHERAKEVLSLVGLDSKTSYEIMNLFDEIYSKGNTVILVTHEEDIANYAKRIIRLKDGLIETDNKQ